MVFGAMESVSLCDASNRLGDLWMALAASGRSGADDLVGCHSAVAIGVQGAACLQGVGAQRHVYTSHDLVCRHPTISIAVARAGRRRRDAAEDQVGTDGS